jgi:hypothetical protein
MGASACCKIIPRKGVLIEKLGTTHIIKKLPEF